MRFTLLALFAFIASTAAAEAQPLGQALDGRWTPRDRSVVINFAPCGASMCATVVEGKLKPSKSDLSGQIVIRYLTRKKKRPVGWPLCWRW